MAADSKSETPVFGSTSHGTCIFPARATSSARRAPPFAALRSRYSISSSQRRSRARRQKGEPSKLQSSRGSAGDREGRARQPAKGAHPGGHRRREERERREPQPERRPARAVTLEEVTDDVVRLVELDSGVRVDQE